MVIVKINTGEQSEREVEIVNEKGDWGNGSYHLFAAHFVHRGDIKNTEPHDINNLAYLGELIVDKDKEYWEYKGEKLNAGEQKETAQFILDYQAPDGVY